MEAHNATAAKKLPTGEAQKCTAVVGIGAVADSTDNELLGSVRVYSGHSNESCKQNPIFQVTMVDVDVIFQNIVSN